MAKKGRYGSGRDDDDAEAYPKGDVESAEERRGKDEGTVLGTGEDGDDEANADTRTEDRPVGSEGFEVVESGTIIDGIYYPKSEGPEADKMIAWLVPAQAQALVDCGVKLKDGEGELMVATPKEEAPPEDELEDETQEVR